MRSHLHPNFWHYIWATEQQRYATCALINNKRIIFIPAFPCDTVYCITCTCGCLFTMFRVTLYNWQCSLSCLRTCTTLEYTWYIAMCMMYATGSLHTFLYSFRLCWPFLSSFMRMLCQNLWTTPHIFMIWLEQSFSAMKDITIQLCRSGTTSGRT